jgi:hypothetical protein
VGSGHVELLAGDDVVAGPAQPVAVDERRDRGVVADGDLGDGVAGAYDVLERERQPDQHHPACGRGRGEPAERMGSTSRGQPVEEPSVGAT